MQQNPSQGNERGEKEVVSGLARLSLQQRLMLSSLIGTSTTAVSNHILILLPRGIEAPLEKSAYQLRLMGNDRVPKGIRVGLVSMPLVGKDGIVWSQT